MKNYTPLENAYSLVVKDNPNDYLEIEIGDEKDISKFQPQVKIMRWDNEVNLSVRFQDDEIDTPTIDTSTDKIKLLTQKKEIHLYEMAPSEKQEAGGYEFEIILKEKPKTNVMSFSMETKGLDFWYQSELTQKGKQVVSPDLMQDVKVFVTLCFGVLLFAGFIYFIVQATGIIGGQSYSMNTQGTTRTLSTNQ